MSSSESEDGEDRAETEVTQERDGDGTAQEVEDDVEKADHDREERVEQDDEPASGGESQHEAKE